MKSRLTPIPPVQADPRDDAPTKRRPAAPPVNRVPHDEGFVNGAALRAAQGNAPTPIRKKRTEKIDQKRTLNFTRGEIEIIENTFARLCQRMLATNGRLNLYEGEIPRIAVHLLAEQSDEDLMAILSKMVRFRQ